MIQLSSRHSMVVETDGKHRQFGFDDISTMLIPCFKHCGITDQWIIENIALFIEEQLESMFASGKKPIGQSRVDSLVSSVLLASGYRDVARKYREKSITPLSKFADLEMTEWNHARAVKQISDLLPVSPQECRDLASQVKRVVGCLGLKKVSDDFIAQLAVHMLEGRTNVGDSLNARTKESPWLIKHDQWAELTLGPAAELLFKGILKIHPISTTLPRVRVTLRLVPMIKISATPPITEIILLTRLRQVCLKSGSLISRARAQACQLKQDARHHPAHLIVRDIREVMDDHMIPLNQRKTRALVQEVRSNIAADARSKIDFPLIVTLH